MKIRIWMLLLGAVCLVGCSSSSNLGTGTGQFSDGCATHLDCGPSLMCVSAACQSAFPRTYVITMGSATVAKYKTSGSNWDALGGAPDPRAALEIDGKVYCQTSTKDDTFDPVWNEQCEVELFQTTNVTVAVWDMDAAEHDPVGGVNLGTPIKDFIIQKGFYNHEDLGPLEKLNITVSLK